MAKPIGSSKTGGRKKGTPNKRTLAFGEVLESRGVDLLGSILDAAKRLPERERIGVYMGLLPYQYPKRKPIEGSASSWTDHLNLLNRDQMADLRDELTGKLGLNKKFEDMNSEERTEYEQAREHALRMIQIREELGDPDEG